jgi:hypothetical protein
MLMPASSASGSEAGISDGRTILIAEGGTDRQRVRKKERNSHSQNTNMSFGVVGLHFHLCRIYEVLAYHTCSLVLCLRPGTQWHRLYEILVIRFGACRGNR